MGAAARCRAVPWVRSQCEGIGAGVYCGSQPSRDISLYPLVSALLPWAVWRSVV